MVLMLTDYIHIEFTIMQLTSATVLLMRIKESKTIKCHYLVPRTKKINIGLFFRLELGINFTVWYDYNYIFLLCKKSR